MCTHYVLGKLEVNRQWSYWICSVCVILTKCSKTFTKVY